MRLLLPPDIAQKLRAALDKAAHREIGGILMGEHIADDVFRVNALTVQRRGGSFAAFLRTVQDFITPLKNFFRVTNYDYTRFNYLGEWHSHPSFIPEPSTTDHDTMRDIIEDQELGAHFVVLMVVKLGHANRLEGSVTVYRPGGLPYRGALIQEEAHG